MSVEGNHHMTKIVINACFGGFGLSDVAYEWLIAKGVPVQAYVKERRGADGLYKPESRNEGEVIFDRDLDDPAEGEDGKLSAAMRRYWDTWTRESRDHPLIVECVETLGERASGKFAKLVVVEIPDGVEWGIDEYDGNEHIAEKHRTWR